METWRELEVRQEREKELFRTDRTVVWESLREQYPNGIPANLLAKWREEYGDVKLTEMGQRHLSEKKAFVNEPYREQPVQIIKYPQTIDEIQDNNEKKFMKYLADAQKILNKGKSHDRTE